MFFLKKGRY